MNSSLPKSLQMRLQMSRGRWVCKFYLQTTKAALVGHAQSIELAAVMDEHEAGRTIHRLQGHCKQSTYMTSIQNLHAGQHVRLDAIIWVQQNPTLCKL